MKNILAIGNAASRIVTGLEKYDKYSVFRICNEQNYKKNCFLVTEYDEPEKYDNPDVLKGNKILGKIKEQVDIFVCGASISSAMTLVVSQALSKKGVKINIVYFQPDLEFVSPEQALMERSAFNILQQYTRSGVFEKITLVSNKQLEKFVDSINVMNYYEQINEVFCSTYYMIDVYRNTQPVLSTFRKTKETCRISTIGVSNLSCEDGLFYPMEGPAEILYYFGINEEKLKNDGNFFKDLTKNVKNKITKTNRPSFGIYATNYEADYVYVEFLSPKIHK